MFVHVHSAMLMRSHFGVIQKSHKTQVGHLLAKQSQKYAFGLYFFATKASRERVPPGSPGVFWKNIKKQTNYPPNRSEH